MRRKRIDHEFRPPLPAVYDDSMTLYEGCAKHRKITNELVEKVSDLDEDLTELEGRVDHIEEVIPDIPDVETKLNQVIEKVEDFGERLDKDEVDINNNTETNLSQTNDINDLETRVTVLEGTAFEGIRPPTQEEFNEANIEIIERLNELKETVYSGYSVEKHFVPVTNAVLVEGASESGGMVVSTDYGVTGYYYQIGALVKGEFYIYIQRPSAVDINWSTPGNYSLMFTTPEYGTHIMPIPRNDIGQFMFTRECVTVGDYVHPNLNTRGIMDYYFNGYKGLNYNWVFNGVCKTRQEADSYLFRLPFEYITDYGESQWDYELYDTDFNYDKRIDTEIHLKTTENINKSYYMEMSFNNLAGKNSSGYGKAPFLLYFTSGYVALEPYTQGNYESNLYTVDGTTKIREAFIAASTTDDYKLVLERDKNGLITYSIYRNGNVVKTTTYTQNSNVSQAPVYIGGSTNQNTDEYPKFHLDSFKFKWT